MPGAPAVQLLAAAKKLGLEQLVPGAHRLDDM